MHCSYGCKPLGSYNFNRNILSYNKLCFPSQHQKAVQLVNARLMAKHIWKARNSLQKTHVSHVCVPRISLESTKSHIAREPNAEPKFMIPKSWGRIVPQSTPSQTKPPYVVQKHGFVVSRLKAYLWKFMNNDSHY